MQAGSGAFAAAETAAASTAPKKINTDFSMTNSTYVADES
jgi:hypothetical protein